MDRLGRRLPYETSPTVGTLVSARYGPGEAMPKARFEIPVEVEFEGRAFPTMSCYREYLTGIYGDYMTPPPENCRGAHIGAVSMAAATSRRCAAGIRSCAPDTRTFRRKAGSAMERQYLTLDEIHALLAACSTGWTRSAARRASAISSPAARCWARRATAASSRGTTTST